MSRRERRRYNLRVKMVVVEETVEANLRSTKSCISHESRGVARHPGNS
jgi:hypothetical protein